MLAPLLTAALLAATLPGRNGTALGAAAIMLGVVTTWPGDWGRRPWEAGFVAARAPAGLVAPGDMLLLTGFSPTSYVLPAFPPSVPAVRIQSNFHAPGWTPTLFGAALERRVAAHAGRFRVLFHPDDREDSRAALAAHGLTLDDAGCAPAWSNIDDGALLVCPALR
jgi:hypothetical protein